MWTDKTGLPWCLNLLNNVVIFMLCSYNQCDETRKNTSYRFIVCKRLIYKPEGEGPNEHCEHIKHDYHERTILNNTVLSYTARPPAVIFQR